MKRLKRSFFNRCTLTVAQDLIGKVLVFNGHQGIITETEAYMGFEDPASHAAKGETPRTKIMFGEPGFSYVYLIYGMYHCLNIVTEQKGFPAAVLIRGLSLLNNSQEKILLNGPGKLCKYLGITKKQNAIDIINHDTFYVADTKQKLEFIETPRIGIKVGTDKLWRYAAIEMP